MKKKITLADETQPRNIQRADVAPAEGFSLVVDGHFKTNYDDEKAAQEAGAALFGRMKTPFQATSGAIEKHFGHCASRNSRAAPVRAPRRLYATCALERSASPEATFRVATACGGRGSRVSVDKLGRGAGLAS